MKSNQIQIPSYKDRLFYDLIKDLYSSLNRNSNKPESLPDSKINYYNRILLSNFSVFQSDEQRIMNDIIETIETLYKNSSKKSLNDQADKFQSLYNKLITKRIPTKRWAMLLILLKLSNENNNKNNIFITNNIIDYNNLNINSYIESEIKSINDIKNDKIDKDLLINNSKIKKLPNIVVNTSKTSKIITEKELISDLMFVFYGIDGHYITYNNNEDAYCLNNVIPFNENIYDIVSFLSELGWLYRKVNIYLNFFNQSDIPSQFIQSFSNAVKNELDEYFKLISFFKKKNEQNNGNSDINANLYNNSDNLNLKNLILWSTEPIERMKWLAISCESIHKLRGTAILSQIYSYVYYSGANIYLNKVLEKLFEPFLKFVKNWVMYGTLEDPYKEFFVDIIEKTDEDDIWTLRYKLVYENIPNFLNKELCVKIFEVGKCINFIKTYCGINDYSISKIKDIIQNQINSFNTNSNLNLNNTVSPNKNTYQNQNQNQIIDIKPYKTCLSFLQSLDDPSSNSENSILFLDNLLSQIHLIHNIINKDVVTIFYKKFNFEDNLTALNRYLLLGQGDMMQSLMESLYDELGKPASHIFKHNLQAKLESAIRSTNAKYNNKDCLNKLNIKLLDASTGDLGWDIFLLEYNVDIPLTVVFKKKYLNEYNKLFFFFWKLKRLEYSQNHQSWRKFMTYAHQFKSKFDKARRIIHTSILFNQQVIHFLSNLHNFIALEVLETQYKKIIDKLPYINSLDELIELHKNFVENIIDQSLLNINNSNIYKKIINIFNTIILFKTALNVLTTTLLENQYSNFNDNMDLSESNILSNKEFNCSAFNQILKLFEQFKNDVNDLINTIQCFGKGNMKFLSMKLDYNYYYSILDKEKESREQAQIVKQMNRQEEFNNNYINNNNNNEDDEDEDNNNDEDEDNDDFREDPSDAYLNNNQSDLMHSMNNNNKSNLMSSGNNNQFGISNMSNFSKNLKNSGMNINVNNNMNNMNNMNNIDNININNNNASKINNNLQLSGSQSLMKSKGTNININNNISGIGGNIGGPGFDKSRISEMNNSNMNINELNGNADVEGNDNFINTNKYNDDEEEDEYDDMNIDGDEINHNNQNNNKKNK